MINTATDQLLEYARTELKTINFDQIDIGNTILQFLEQSAELTGNDASSMKQLANILLLLIDRYPISPITEDDFQLEQHGENLTMMRCTRYPYIYQSSDGKYWNDRAVAFKFKDAPDGDIMFLYRPNGSKREITLPYFPSMAVEYINEDNV